MSDLRDKIARGTWDTLGSDYTFDEAVSGQEKATHAQAVKWVYNLADAILALIRENVPPLVWGETSYGRPEAFALNGVYRIQPAADGGFVVHFGKQGIPTADGRMNHLTEQAAKAAANEHHRQAVLKAAGLSHE
jgi:hypothetical protein